MVLRLKPWESRSPPDPQIALKLLSLHNPIPAGWSSPVARQAHNLKVAGSNPAPATKQKRRLPNGLGGVLLCGFGRDLAKAEVARDLPPKSSSSLR
jgi:hypothetical protein